MNRAEASSSDADDEREPGARTSDGLRDYVEWHGHYDDPDSDLSWRLRMVRSYLSRALDEHEGRLRVLSSCSGDGRDLLGVLAGREDRDRVEATLIEVHPEIAQRARDAAATAGLGHLEVRIADAGVTDAYEGAVPADIVIMVGIFGNISDVDLEATIETSPQLCKPGATLVWSRGRHRDDRTELVRRLFRDAGFVELDYAARETGSRPALGAMRYDGPSRPLVTGRRIFTFVH